MRTGTNVVIAATVILGLGADAMAQRRGGAEDAASGPPAKIVYRQDFEKENFADFQAVGYGNIRFLKAIEPEAESKAKPEGFAVSWKANGVGGSKGMLEIARTEAKAERATAEKYMEWPGDDTTVIFAYRARGVNSSDNAYVSAWGTKINKSLHQYLDVREDEWQVAKIKTASLVGFGGGGCQEGEQFGNLLFVLRWAAGASDARFQIDNIVIFQGQDNKPPTRPPSNLTTAFDAKKGSVNVKWNPAEDDVGVYNYEIHRAESAGFEPKKNTRAGTAVDTVFEDRDVAGGKVYYYRIVGKDAGGNAIASDEVSIKIDAANRPASDKPAEF